MHDLMHVAMRPPGVAPIPGVRNISCMEIAGSARKHGIADADMLHAVRNPMRRISQDDDAILILGADRTGRLLEVVVVDREGDQRVIHAMELRRAFRRYLR